MPPLKKNTGNKKPVSGLQSLYAELEKSYWAAKTPESKNRIQAVADELYDMISEANSAEFSGGKNDYRKLSRRLKKANSRINELAKDIKNIEKAVKLATAAAKILDASAEAAAKL